VGRWAQHGDVSLPSAANGSFGEEWQRKPFARWQSALGDNTNLAPAAKRVFGASMA